MKNTNLNDCDLIVMETITDLLNNSSSSTSSSTPTATEAKKDIPSIDFDSLSPADQKKWVLDTFGDEFYAGDFEATLAFVRENWKILKYATEERKNDEEILMHARKFVE